MIFSSSLFLSCLHSFVLLVQRKVTEHGQRRQCCKMACNVMAGARVRSYITEVLTGVAQEDLRWWLVRWSDSRKRTGCCVSSSSIKLYITSDNWHQAPLSPPMMPAYVKQSMLLHLHIKPLLPRSNSVSFSNLHPCTCF